MGLLQPCSRMLHQSLPAFGAGDGREVVIRSQALRLFTVYALRTHRIGMDVETQLALFQTAVQFWPYEGTVCLFSSYSWIQFVQFQFDHRQNVGLF